jgi:hypothetical protein
MPHKVCGRLAKIDYFADRLLRARNPTKPNPQNTPIEAGSGTTPYKLTLSSTGLKLPPVLRASKVKVIELPLMGVRNEYVTAEYELKGEEKTFCSLVLSLLNLICPPFKPEPKSKEIDSTVIPIGDEIVKVTGLVNTEFVVEASLYA